MREGKSIPGDNKEKLGNSSPQGNDTGAEASTAPVTPSTPEKQTTSTAAGSVTAEAGMSGVKPSAQEKQKVSPTMDGTKSDESSSTSSSDQENLPNNAWKRNTDKLAAIRQAVLKV